MRDKVFYEWAVEEWGDGDILDNSFYDTISPDFLFWEKENLTLANYKLCLWRRLGNDLDGITDATWAYVENGKLPTTFEDGIKIPKYKKKELIKIFP